MHPAIATISNDPERLSTWIDRLVQVFRDMDDAYERAAEQCGFACRGCEDNCCQTRFHHHTLLEYLAIYMGFQQLTAPEKASAKAKAAAAFRAYARADAAGKKIRVWCPLNRDGRCRVYALRPMICRLHGIPHALHSPGGGIVRGPGCGQFDLQRQNGAEAFLDRTPLYRAMATLEKEFRGFLGANDKLKLTIAEMVRTF